MGYAANTPSARQHLQEKVRLAFVKDGNTLLEDASQSNKELGESIVQNPDTGLHDYVNQLSNRGITVESTDAEIDTQVTTPDMRKFAKRQRGIDTVQGGR